jgi:hypothetical protein
MQTPGNLPLEGDRYTPFLRTLTFQGIDLTGAVMSAQVRDRKDGGTVRADLDTVLSSSAEGIYLVSAGTVEGVLTSVITIRINEATMEAFPFGTEIGDDLDLWWDMHITPSGGTKQKYLHGVFTLRSGVTQ